MPGFDRTGPAGQGSRTGKQKGRCSTKNFSFENVLPDKQTPETSTQFIMRRRKGKNCGNHDHQQNHGHNCQHHN